MEKSKPYQPLWLRLLHGVVAIVALLAIITAFLVYNVFDGRFGKLPLPEIQDIMGVHGTLGLTLLILFPLFALYSFHAGQRRLIQPDSLAKLSQVGQPIWWYSLHRIANTGMLLAVTWALITGRMMKEEWLANGDLAQLGYSLHLLSWLILVIFLLIHWGMSFQVGGTALLLSMVNAHIRAKDSPRHWPNRLGFWLRERRKIFSKDSSQ